MKQSVIFKWFKIRSVAIVLTLFALNLNAQKAAVKLRWVDVKELCIEGKGWTDSKQFYDRLPAKAQGVVRPSIWELQHDAAGIVIRFVTNGTTIAARWTLTKSKLSIPNVSASGVSGLDLYVRENGKWGWFGAARPDEITNEKNLTTGLSSKDRECMLYLPLRNGIEKLEIGIPEDASCSFPPERPKGMKPIVFYGTSIVQGAAASRPGMTYPALICRHLDRTMINLGFAGNAVCEPEMAALLAELDPALYIIDPLPNMSAQMVKERTGKLIATIRVAHPKTPIIMVENTEMGDAPTNPTRRNGYTAANLELRKIYEQRIKEGDRKLYYIHGDKLLGTDGEGTVDRVHPTDLGFMRMIKIIEPVVKRALKRN
jgi:lysophospholipase L1-like esterase